MKKVFFLVAVLTLSMFYSCEKEAVEANESNVVTQDAVSKFSSSNWTCSFIEIKGIQIAGGCFPNSDGEDTCGYELRCESGAIFQPGDFCFLLPCRPDISDPWVFPDVIDPSDFPNLMEEYKLNIDPKIAVIPFALNEKIAGLQFNKAAGMFKDNIYYVKSPLNLDVQNSKKLGLHGNMVKAGKYPVIFNEKNGTLNVILAVEKGFKF